MPATRWTEEHDRLLAAAAPDVGVSAEDIERG